MPKGTRHPVLYPDVTIGNWYQARFEFKVDDNAAEQSTASSAMRTRNKSHRVYVLTKITDANNPLHGSAICLLLTSFGGGVDLATARPSSFDQLKYLAVNSTAQSLSSPYSAIPISIRALYGFVDFTSEYQLPIAQGGDAAIMHMREAGKANAAISSPPWAVEYIRRLKIAWTTWLVCDEGDEAKWVGAAKAVTAEFGEKEGVAVEAGPSGGVAAGTKRLLDDNDDKGKGKAKRQHSGPRWLDGNESEEDHVSETDHVSEEDHVSEFEDSGIHDMDGDVMETTEFKPAEPTVHQRLHHPVPGFPVLVGVALYHLGDDEDDIDEEVDFGLLNALFRPML